MTKNTLDPVSFHDLQKCHLRSQPYTPESAQKTLKESIENVIPGCHIKAIVIYLLQAWLNGQMLLLPAIDTVSDKNNSGHTWRLVSSSLYYITFIHAYFLVRKVAF